MEDESLAQVKFENCCNHSACEELWMSGLAMDNLWLDLNHLRNRLKIAAVSAWKAV